ncbi:serine/threonine-protein kinase psk1 [Niveomyces insectorum RCEF 264]|uniref:Serine/threonine-protein kinase psk1 n=1 Tax=Niveomyces insectorum RCEF 264 TaxID=1081102 RepID=A0A168A0B4_9HYPO|nr:serine/threonine-protein kinase psk1 [Niveomyces insectorum RCEF 264]
MDAPPPALTTVRGFHGTPVTSGDEDSDYGVGGNGRAASRRGRKKRLSGLDDVVMLRPTGSPAVSGIAKLRMQLEPLSLDTSAASSRASSPAAKTAPRTPLPAAARPASVIANRIASPLSPEKQQRQHHQHESNQSNGSSQSSRDGQNNNTLPVGNGHLGSSSPCKTTSSDISRAPTNRSSRSTSHDDGRVSSNTSGDESTEAEAKGRDGTTSYVIRLENDFVSESVREEDRRAVDDASAIDAGGDHRFAIFDADIDTTAIAADTTGERDATKVDVEGDAGRGESTKEPLPRKKMTADDFEPLRCLGKGSYGTVLLVKQHSTGRLYAQKQFKKASLVVHKKLVEQTKTERQILESVNRHPFVVKLYYAFQDREKLYLILEYGQGGELFTHLSTERMFSEATAAFYMAEMVLALSHLHSTLGVVYRDLKPENCLLDAEGHLLLTDFGLSKVALPGARDRAASGATDDTDDACCHSMLGTVEYMAPEVVQGHKYGRAVDWWSLGALGYDLLTGNPPFRGRNNAKIQENIVRQKLVLPYFLSPDAKDLLTRLLRKEPRKRLGASMPKDLAVIKGHRFFRKIDWSRLSARELEPPIQPVITDPELAENFASEFTELPLSPVMSPTSRVDKDAYWSSPMSPRGRGRSILGGGAISGSIKDDPFGGFSFVASTSLLNESNFPVFE